MMAPVTAVIIGAGDRGLTYASYALDFPDKFKACINLQYISHIHTHTDIFPDEPVLARCRLIFLLCLHYLKNNAPLWQAVVLTGTE